MSIQAQINPLASPEGLCSKIYDFIDIFSPEQSLHHAGWDAKYRLLAPGEFRLKAFASSFQQRVSVSVGGIMEVGGTIPAGVYGFLTMTPEAYLKIDKQAFLKSGPVVILTPKTRYRLITGNATHSFALLPSPVIDCVTFPTADDVLGWIKQSKLLQGIPPREFRVGNWSEDPKSGDRFRHETHFENACKLIDRTNGNLTSGEMARTLGVGVRSIERAFASCVGIKPSRYLQARRLNIAFRLLRKRHIKDSSVTEIALDSGCPHLGRFSVSYKALFGESPRATLAR